MIKYTVARQLAGKRIFTNRGDVVGKLVDIYVDEKTGELVELLVEIDPTSKVVKRLGITEKTITIPFAAVVAVSDVVIIDEAQIPAPTSE